MAQATNIEWTDLSWNPIHGCSKVSPGCAHCYAAELSLRYGHTTKPWTPANATLRTEDNPDGNIILKPKKLREPLSGAKDWQGLGAAAAKAGKTDGKLVFVNSMSDLFHEQVPDEYIAEVFAVMALAERHTFQILTKRPERMAALLTGQTNPFWGRVSAAIRRRAGLPRWWFDADRTFVPNVWLGTSIENRRFVGRADALRETPAAVRFISAEPLLGPLVAPAHPSGWGLWPDGVALGATSQLDLTDIDWLIVGGESGSGHRPMREEWVRDLRAACLEQCVGCRMYGADHLPRCRPGGGGRTAFFVKQWGGARPGGEALLDGREWREFPQVSRRVAERAA